MLPHAPRSLLLDASASLRRHRRATAMAIAGRHCPHDLAVEQRYGKPVDAGEERGWNG